MKLPKIGSRGQQWEVMKLLQGGVIAVLMLIVVYGVVSSVRGQTPRSDVYSVSCEILGSAYAARGTGERFVREALLVEQEIFSEALVQCSGLPSGTSVKMMCKHAFCLHDGEPLNRGSDCRLHSPCSSMEFVAGDTINVCAVCDEGECRIWFGESEC
ncbi:MAG: hypothetical protein KAW41_04470 [Candidatus Diapherotrites archaeon]|nr:hypothetical protein [Candidatus Diapherotrites archaeon]